MLFFDFSKKLVRHMVSTLRKNVRANEIETAYGKRYRKYSFTGEKCIDNRQYEAVITRWYHTVEKGLSYVNYRAGFGKENLEKLVTAMQNYASDGYDTDAFFYRTALSTLHEYIDKNAQYGVKTEDLERKILHLPGKPNQSGGAFYTPLCSECDVQRLGYKDFVEDRHSFRHFSSDPVDLNKVEAAIKLAQKTPSACNRQGWKTRIVIGKENIKFICDNQNGNRGFGHEFDVVLFITGDLRCFNRDREFYQVYIDGGMYAESILNALHYYHLASVPLSASLTIEQETHIRSFLKIQDAEVPIMIIGVGNYPPEKECLIAKSSRRPADYEVIR